MTESAGIRAVVSGFLLAGVLVTTMPCVSAYAEDAKARCVRTGDDDQVRPLPGSLILAARRMFEIPAATADADVRTTTAFRCMKGAVWLCSYGANLVCDKADASRVSPGADQFCKQNPGSTSIPMSATGHATVYDWTCAGTQARVVRQVTDVDARGFIAGNWKQLP